MLRWLFLFLGLGTAQVAKACEGPTYAGDIQEALSRAEAHFSRFEVPEFEEALAAAFDHVDCLAEPADAHLSASLHRFAGIRAFGADELDVSRRSFAAARALEPAYVFPSSLFAKDHPIQVEYSALAPVDASEPVPRLADGRFLLNGSSSETRGIDRPVLIQWIGADGGIKLSRYLEPGQPLPEAPRFQGAPTSPVIVSPVTPPTETKVKKPRKGRWIAVAGGGALLATSALTYTGAMLQKAQFRKENADNFNTADGYERTLRGYQTRANALTIVSGVTGAGAIGLGVSAAFVGQF